jgi:hypothetical protein
VKVVVQQRLALIEGGSPMPTQCNQEELDFGSSGGRKLVGAFDGGAITSNGVHFCSVRPTDPFG